MATGKEVLSMLIPTGGWVIYGDDFDSIIYDEGVLPVSAKDFKDGFPKVDAWKAKEAAAAEARKAEILNRLGITADEAALLLG
jgi:hypothetical protein